MKIGKLSTHGYADQSMTDGQLLLPAGSNLSRPITADDGMIRYNTSTGGVEGFSRGWWSDFLTTAEFQIPGAEIDEDENVTIASLAILLSQFQRTVTGGVDMRGSSSSHDILHGEVQPIPNPLTSEFSYLSGSAGILPPTRGTIEGYKDTAGKGETYLAVVGQQVTYATRDAWNISGYTSGMGGQIFQQIIDPYKLTGFAEEERYNYLLEYFSGVYNVDWRASGYTVVGGDSWLTPAWNIQDPYNDPNYGKLILTVNLRNAAGVFSSSSKVAQANDIFAKWYVKFVKFRGFSLKSSPGFTPGAGSSPMPTDPATGLDAPPAITIKSDTRGLIIKDYLMRKYPTWTPNSPISVAVHIESDKALYSNLPSQTALDCTNLPAGSTVFIKNEGYIIGGGGKGGQGSGWVVNQSTKAVEFSEPTSGATGGDAFLSDGNITVNIDNTSGIIAGGGGGGGGGAARNIWGGDKVYAAGAGAGGGGVSTIDTSIGAAGQGITYNIVGNTPEIKTKGWDSTGGAGGDLRDGSGLIQWSGGTSGVQGTFIIPNLSGGTGGTGGVAGGYGSPGKDVSTYPNVAVIGWGLSAGGGPDIEPNDYIEIDGNKITFVAGTAGSGEYELNSSATDNNSVWLQTLVDTGVFDSSKYDIYVFEDTTGTGHGEILDPTGGTYVWRELVLGLVLVSKSTGGAAETWTHDFFSTNNRVTSVLPQGSGSATKSGGAGGGPGSAIKNAIKNYGVVDITTTPATFTTNPAGEGDIRGSVS